MCQGGTMTGFAQRLKAPAMFAGIIAVTVLFAGALLVRPSPPHLAQHEDRPECPHDGIILRKDPNGQLYVNPATVPEEEYLTDIPELHDCQRFIVRGAQGFQYDSLYAIFARPETLSIFKTGEVSPDTILGPNQSVQLFNKGLTAVALITSYGGTYDPLGIRPGVSCLYLAHERFTWSARVVHNGNSGTCPAQPGAGTSLEVRENILPPHLSGLDDVPAVARWDWSPDQVQ